MKIHLVNEANTFQFLGTNDDTDERFYIASSSIQGLEGLTAYYEGGLQANAWADLTGNGHDMRMNSSVGVISYPPDTISATSKTLIVENFSWSSYQYDFLPIGYEIIQIVITPNQAVPNTSNAESDYDKNILRIYDGNREFCKHHLPAIPANISYVIQPINGLNLNYTYLNIDSIYTSAKPQPLSTQLLPRAIS